MSSKPFASPMMITVSLVVLVGGCKEKQPKKAPDTGVKTADPAAVLDQPQLAKKEASKAQVEQAILVLTNLVKKGASDPTNPWTMAHGIVAFGKNHRTTDGRLAVDVIVEDYVEKRVVKKQKVYRFPKKSGVDNIPVDPHSNTLIKVMLSAGIPLTRAWKLKSGETVTLERLLKDAETTFAFPKTEEDWVDFSWSMAALVSRGAKAELNTAGGKLKVEDLVSKTIEELEKRQAFLHELLIKNAPDLVEKRKQGIYVNPCGGMHMIQGAAMGASVVKDARLADRVRTQMDILLFRWEAERRIYVETLDGLDEKNAKFRWLVMVQQLKFFGHLLETFGLAQKWGVIQADEDRKRKLRYVIGDLIFTIVNLERAYSAQDKLKTEVPRTYHDLIGDGAHAIHGLRLSLVAFFPG